MLDPSWSDLAEGRHCAVGIVSTVSRLRLVYLAGVCRLPRCPESVNVRVMQEEHGVVRRTTHEHR